MIHPACFDEDKDDVVFRVIPIESKGVDLIVSKNLDVMKNTCLGIALGRRQKVQFASKRGSVVCYVTKRVLFCASLVEVSSLRSSVAGWNAVLRAC